MICISRVLNCLLREKSKAEETPLKAIKDPNSELL